MQRIKQTYFIKNFSVYKEKLLQWGDQNKTVCWLDSNEHVKKQKEGILAVGVLSSINVTPKNAFHQLSEYLTNTKDYAFGFLGYDLKNDTENLNSNNLDEIEFPDLFFFQPEKIIEIQKDQITFIYPVFLEKEIENDWNVIQNTKTTSVLEKNNITIHSRITKETYVQQVNKALSYIQKGKIYELNFCQEFYAKNAKIDPLATYTKLNKISKAPFASYFKHLHLHILSASPERFIKRENSKLTSEPIKGTAKREENSKKDAEQIQLLKNNTKEIAENIMIVDLVRNDMSLVAKKGSVKVEELCKIYTFEQVHQMISTISCNLKENINSVEAIKACYPMGSMTGAPKIAAMKFIEDLENFKRGVYSGAIGYFTPEQNFDFNVVIRSILYNKNKKQISFSVGSAITAKADPEKEYEECLLKAKALKTVLN